ALPVATSERSTGVPPSSMTCQATATIQHPALNNENSSATASRRNCPTPNGRSARGRRGGVLCPSMDAPRVRRPACPIGARTGTTVVAMPFTPVETAVLDALDEHALVQRLVDLVRTPSITGTDAE